MPQASYVCRSCESSSQHVRPRRVELGLVGRSKITETAERWIGLLGAEMSFARASSVLKEVAGLKGIYAKQVERVSKRLGAKVEAFQKTSEVVVSQPVENMYMEIDGTGIPARPGATAGRAGKAEDGVARTREVKIMATWQNAKDTPQYDAGIEPVTSAMDEPTFTQRYLRHTSKTGFNQAKRQTLISDGAEWIKGLVVAHHPETTCILDIHHALQHIHTACEEHYGDERRTKSKFKELKHKLATGQLQSVIRCLYQFGSTSTINYLLKNADRLDYPAYKEAGLPTSSARIESACKNVIGSRFKKGGMRWSLAGIKPLLELRCLICSNRLDDYYDAVKRDRQSMLAVAA